MWSCKKTSQTKSSCTGAYKNFASSCCSASLVLLWNFSWTRLIFGLQSTELLVYGWGLGHPRPSAVKLVCHASASTRPPLFISELAYTKIVGEQIKFGSVAGEVLSTNAQLVAAEDVERTSTSTAIASFPFVLPTVTSHEYVACSEL